MGFVQVFQLYNFIPFSSYFKLIFECLLVGIFTYASPQSFFCLSTESRKIGNHLSNFFMKVLFIMLQVFISCLVIPQCH